MSMYLKLPYLIPRIFAAPTRKSIQFSYLRRNISDKVTYINSEMNSSTSHLMESNQSDIISESTNEKLPSSIFTKSSLSETIAKLSLELETISQVPVSSSFPVRPLPSNVLSPIGNLAAIVNECDALRRLMSEGVDLALLELLPGVPNFLIKLDVEREIEPLIHFLSDKSRLALTCATKLESPAKQSTQVGMVLQAVPRLLQLSIEVYN